MKHLISIHDLSRDEIEGIFDLARELKEKHRRREAHRLLEGQTLAMIFEKPSTRTRVSFEVGINQLGGTSVILGSVEFATRTRRDDPRHGEGLIALRRRHHGPHVRPRHGAAARRARDVCR